MPPATLHDLSFAQMQSHLAEAGVRAAHAGTLFRALHQDCRTELSGFLPPLQRWVDAQPQPCVEVPPLVCETPSGDGVTRKFLLRLRDGQEIETVLMGYAGRYTACLSTQAGCAMGCVFCATGQMGFVRHLRPGEIVAQVHHARRVLAEQGKR